jgi:hypothetical protein
MVVWFAYGLFDIYGLYETILILYFKCICVAAIYNGLVNVFPFSSEWNMLYEIGFTTSDCWFIATLLASSVWCYKTWGFHGVFLRSVLRLLVTASVFPTSPILVILMKEALSSSETSVLTRATRRNIPEDAILHSVMLFRAVTKRNFILC